MSRILIVLVVAYVLLAIIVFLRQRSMLYHPSTGPIEVLAKLASDYGFQEWRNQAGQYIGWKRLGEGTGPRNRVLIVHGNAGSAVDRTDYAAGLKGVMSCDIYILEYPGYGARPGAPTQKTLFDAADEAVSLITKDGALVYVIGESLGTGVASYLAGTHPKIVAGLLLIAPYHNLTAVAQNHMPIFPVRLLLLDKYPSAQYLRDYHGPLGVLLAGADDVVPKRFGRQLYDEYIGPKKVWEIPNAGHDDLSERGQIWWKELAMLWKTGAVATAASPVTNAPAHKEATAREP